MRSFFPKHSSNECQDRFLKDLLNHIKKRLHFFNPWNYTRKSFITWKTAYDYNIIPSLLLENSNSYEKPFHPSLLHAHTHRCTYMQMSCTRTHTHVNTHAQRTHTWTHTLWLIASDHHKIEENSTGRNKYKWETNILKRFFLYSVR